MKCAHVQAAGHNSWLEALSELEQSVLDCVWARAPQFCPCLRDEQVLAVCLRCVIQPPFSALQDSAVAYEGFANVGVQDQRQRARGRGVAGSRWPDA
jgi:hypothetical protein